MDGVRADAPRAGAADRLALMAPVFFDPHVCEPPTTWNLIGHELDWTCGCGLRWRLEHYLIEGELLGPSWIPL
jgi:hypothetical protein